MVATSPRNVYLRLISVEEARATVSARFPGPLDAEVVPSARAAGRVLAAAVHARWSSPTYHGAAMDGFAVRARETFGASEHAPLDLPLDTAAWPVNTGDPLPEGTDAVIMIEHVQEVGTAIRIEAPAHPWQHVRRVGEDIVATEMLFPRAHRLGPTCLGALLAGGVLEVAVTRRPRVHVIPTGTEVVPPDRAGSDPPKPGAIVEFNGTMLANLVEAHGGEATLGGCLADDLDAITGAVREAARGPSDLVLVIGGSSAGARDLTRAALARAGEVLFHGVAMMPGKPVVFAVVEGKPVFGVPGYPVSAILCFDQLVAPLLARLQGAPEPVRQVVSAHPTRKIASRLGMDEFVRVRLGRVGDRMVATPLPRGAGAVTTFTQADGILRIPTDIEGVHPHEPAPVELLRPVEEVERNVVVAGSHDLCIDLVADLLRARGTGVGLSSSHVGSLAGLRAIRDGAAHLGGSHLLDPSDGSYNTSFVRRFLAGIPVRLVHVALREQGLAILPGNPCAIRSLADLARPDVAFMNRQAGSGTRVLLDHLLAAGGIAAAAIRGYEAEEYTHMAVAVAVASGRADAGMCIRAAARALGLDFIPLATECYEMVVPERFFDHPGVREVLAVLGSEAFRARARALGGYDPSRAGEVRLPG